MANSNVGIRLSIGGADAVKGTLDGVNNKLGALGAKAKEAGAGFGALQGAIAGIVTVGGAMALIKMADAVTTLNTSLKLSAGAAGDAGKAFNALFAIAQRTRTSFTELGAPTPLLRAQAMRWVCLKTGYSRSQNPSAWP